jgi:hypothetical protein
VFGGSFSARNVAGLVEKNAFVTYASQDLKSLPRSAATCWKSNTSFNGSVHAARSRAPPLSKSKRVRL